LQLIKRTALVEWELSIPSFSSGEDPITLYRKQIKELASKVDKLS
jgi:hypothetical protein